MNRTKAMSDKSDTIKRSGRKQHFINELLGGSCLGNVAVAAKRIGVSRQTLYRWREEDPKFASVWSKAKNEVDELIIEKAESALIGAIDSGNITAIIFTLKARAPEKWCEKSQQNREYNGTIEEKYSISPEFSNVIERMANNNSSKKQNKME